MLDAMVGRAVLLGAVYRRAVGEEQGGEQCLSQRPQDGTTRLYNTAASGFVACSSRASEQGSPYERSQAAHGFVGAKAISSNYYSSSLTSSFHPTTLSIETQILLDAAWVSSQLQAATQH
jgi:hypothetical protein